jgi:hypothetical protein
LNPNSTELVTRLQDAVEQYETLRKAVLEQVLPLKAHHGLALFLDRGLWAWAQLLSPHSDSSLAKHPTGSPDWSVAENSRTAVYVLAAIAMNTR